MNKSLLFGSLLKKCQPLNHRFISCTASKCDATGGQTSSVKKTALYDLHIERKGKVVDFAGYLLPVQYADLGISASHLHTRNSASIFDVSHMLQTYVRGNDAIECFESICTADIKGLKYNSGTLTVFTNESGGIFDDLIVSKINDDLLYVVSNAACRTQDIGIINEAIVSIRKCEILSLTVSAIANNRIQFTGSVQTTWQGCISRISGRRRSIFNCTSRTASDQSIGNY